MNAPVLPLPASRAEIETLQRERKRVAVEQARKAAFYQGRLDHVDLDRLDDPDHWRTIPILDKEQLRAIPPDRFYRDFCLAGRGEIAEYWRSGGATGRPLMYPRTFADMSVALATFARGLDMAGCGPGDSAHISFPLGIHPVGQAFARAAYANGIGVNWAGAGASTPSATQIELIEHVKPTIWMGMASYGIHLANVARAQGVDLAQSSVAKIICSAEPLSPAKREKLERDWGAEVFDVLGMTECTVMAGESDRHDGLHLWTDVSFVEVLDPETLEPVAEGEPGLLIMTPLFTNNATPFLRWNSGDIVTWHEHGATDGPYSVFPMIRHCRRTAGFFKVRGVNINHGDLEDLMFRDRDVDDFKAEAITREDGGDQLRLTLEIGPEAAENNVAERLKRRLKETFGLTPEITVAATGTLAREFETAIKAPRFTDLRG